MNVGSAFWTGDNRENGANVVLIGTQVEVPIKKPLGSGVKVAAGTRKGCKGWCVEVGGNGVDEFERQLGEGGHDGQRIARDAKQVRASYKADGGAW